MKIPFEIYNSKMDEVAIALKEPIIPVKLFENYYLYKVGKYNYYKDNIVHPEFYNLMHVPWALCVSITFESDALKLSKSEKGRRRLIKHLLRMINSRIVGRRVWLESGYNTVRAAWVVEYDDTLLEDERHCHLLLHFHQECPPQEMFESYSFLSRMSGDDLTKLGIATMDVQAVLGKQAECVSYLCKMQWGREFKTFDYSQGFLPIIKRRFLPVETKKSARAA